MFCVQAVGAVHSSAPPREQQRLHRDSFLRVFTPCWLCRETHHCVLHTNLTAQKAQSTTLHPGVYRVHLLVALRSLIYFVW